MKIKSMLCMALISTALGLISGTAELKTTITARLIVAMVTALWREVILQAVKLWAD